MYNPQLIADRQRDIKIVEGYFADYPGAKWRQREPASTSYGSGGFGDPSVIIQGATQRGRKDSDGNPSTRFARYGSLLPHSNSRLARYNGFGGFHRFGVIPQFMDTTPWNLWNDAMSPETLADDDFSARIGYVPGAYDTDTSAIAIAPDSGPSVWDRLFGAAGSAAGSVANQQAAQSGGIVGSVLNLFGVGKKAAPTMAAQQHPQSKMPLLLGGAAVLAGIYLVTRHH